MCWSQTHSTMSTASRPVTLDARQSRVISRAAAGANIFLTGVAGTGKTEVLTKIIRNAEARGRRVCKTATTGVAALNIGGDTLHSFAGLAAGVPRVVTDFSGIREDRREVMRAAHVLVVDEVSMAGAEFLDWLSVAVRAARAGLPGADAPFGGLQLIFCADFAQLGAVSDEPFTLRNEPPPPLPREPPAVPGEPAIQLDEGAGDIPLGVRELQHGYAFMTACWREARFEVHKLEKIYRQDDAERELQAALADVREARADSPRVRALVRSCDRPLAPKNGVEPTVLYCCNSNVDRENAKELEKLDGEAREYESVDKVTADSSILDAEARRRECGRLGETLRHSLAAKTLRLKVGAQVMLLQNRREVRDAEPRDQLLRGSHAGLSRSLRTSQATSGSSTVAAAWSSAMRTARAARRRPS